MPSGPTRSETGQPHAARVALDEPHAVAVAVLRRDRAGEADDRVALDGVDAAGARPQREESEDAGAGAEVHDHRSGADGLAEGAADRLEPHRVRQQEMVKIERAHDCFGLARQTNVIGVDFPHARLLRSYTFSVRTEGLL
jgi:hypothetical protein